MSLRVILTWAYNLRAYQITGSPEVISQLNSNFYDIVMNVPPGVTQDQFRSMMQGLLIERFHLALHHETKEFDAYELVIGKNGSKLKESSQADQAFDQRSPGQRLTKDANGVPHLEHPGTITFMQPGASGRPTTTLLLARAQSLDPLLVNLNMNLNRPWVDKTGLTGIYDYSLEFAPENLVTVTPDGAPIPPPPPAAGQTVNAPNDPAPNLFSALQQQLGLRLDSKKIPFDVIVIDHADKAPTGN
jgi:uncharacterized protein (TIGR03435 family)